MINISKTKTFEGGYSVDLNDNAEKSNTFQKATNGRLFVKNNVLAFSAGKGTRLVYQNEKIVKYLGYFSFKDQVLIFAKCLKEDLVENEEDIFDDNFSSVDNDEIQVDISKYYGTYLNPDGFSLCSSEEDDSYPNNEEYLDCFLLLNQNNDNTLTGEIIWKGYQNWPIKGKITAEGIEENQFYKRAYYTDALNVRRVVNLKDKSISFRSGEDFNQIIENTLLQPVIEEVVDGGQLKSMRSSYTYRIISENGQVSGFSPFSSFADVLAEDSSIDFRGGNISEGTGKAVKIKCNTLNFNPSSEIQCVAIEYEAFGPPTAIRNLGRKSLASVVSFSHFGNEPEFADDITINDILEFKNTWKYCNDYSSKKNKLIAGGLRNDPTPSAINNLEYLFPLHSWAENGSSFDSLMNPKPWEFRYIDPTFTGDIFYVSKKRYTTISSYGPLTISLKNKDSGSSISRTFNSLSLQNYTDILPSVIEWLIQAQTDASFQNLFPNLKVDTSGENMLFVPIDENIETKMSNYIFESNNKQFVENFDNNLVYLNPSINLSKKVYGAQSVGFNEGTGVRVSYRHVKKPLLNKATDVYDGTGKVLDYVTPDLEKIFMKGEIYRIAFQAYDLDSTRFFSIPMGDVMIPNIGDVKSHINDQGILVLDSTLIVNQSDENGVLYGHGIKMNFEVKIPCDLKKKISMYQIVYVERDEQNRTILCQGISAPLTRLQDSGSDAHRVPDVLRNKWNLPYYGGPTYEKFGLESYDAYGENDQYTGEAGGSEANRRTMTSRRLMYFDSPDLYFNRISDQYISESIVNVVAKLNTDHTPGVIRERGGNLSGNSANFGNEIYPKYSRKILEQQIEGNNNSEDLPRYAPEEGHTATLETHFVNVSVFSKTSIARTFYNIEKAKTLLRGEVISGSALNVDNDISNNALVLPSQPWYYSSYARDWKYQDGRANSEIIQYAVTSPGYKTVVLKTTQDLFTDAFIGPEVHVVDPQVRLGGSSIKIVFDTIPLINLYRNNRESIYGGRSKEAYSQNTYIPLTGTIPVKKDNNSVQVFQAEGDSYITLNVRLKNDYGEDELKKFTVNNDGGARNEGDIETWQRNGAFAYVVVLESQVEPKMAYNYEFYKTSGTHSFNEVRPEIINPAYFNENNLKNFLPRPFKFKDDPNQGNVIAVSDVKLAGEAFDSWTVFKPNNFYALLEKNKGDISNLVKNNEEIFAIQEDQTSLIYIGTDRVITDQEGNSINVKQGSGTVVDGHKVLSKYGTSIRRNVVESSDYKFTFFDEKNVEFVKLNEPLLLENSLHLKYWNMFNNDPIIDCEMYFDHSLKETNVRIKTATKSFLLSYSEVFGKFNGELEYTNDIFLMFNKRVYSPIYNLEKSVDLHQLNEGNVLEFFNEKKKLVLGYYINHSLEKVFQYKAWGAISSLKYPFEKIFFKSNIGYDRNILGTHEHYIIREGTHTVPAINDTLNDDDISDVRGSWVYVEMTVESKDNSEIDILATLNSLRESHR